MVKKSAEFFLGKNYEMLKRKFEKALATLGKINVIDDVFVNQLFLFLNANMLVISIIFINYKSYISVNNIYFFIYLFHVCDLKGSWQ